MGTLEPVEHCLRTVTGEQTRLLGRVGLSIQLGSQKLQQQMWVADILDDCLLGLDFLVPHHCQLDLAEDVLYLGAEEISLTKPRSTELGLQCYRAVVTSTVQVPPLSEVIVPVRVDGLSGGERWGVLEDIADPGGRGWKPVLVGRTVVDLQQPVIPVRVMNLDTNGKKLKRGTTLAQCEEVVSVVTPSPGIEASTPTRRELPPHLVSLYESSTVKQSAGEADKVKQLLTDFSDVFSSGPMDLGRTGLVKHRITTADAPPSRQRPRRIPFALRKETEQVLEEMRHQDVIEPSSSPWTSPVVLVRKKDGSLRFCVDYRRLNSLTHKDSYPLPRIDETLEALAGSQWFSSLDLRSGYWQVELAPDDKEKTAFSTGAGLWQFRVMPFGLCNAPATFERLMEQVLAGMQPSIALVYLDDILVHSKSFPLHILHLRGIFERLRQAGLKLSPKKCSLFQQKVKYLGRGQQGGGGCGPQQDRLCAGMANTGHSSGAEKFPGSVFVLPSICARFC